MMKTEHQVARQDVKQAFKLNQRKPISIPLMEMRKKLPETAQDLEEKVVNRPEKGRIAFALMSRGQKSSKQTKLSKVELPADARVVSAIRKNIEQERAEREEVKESTMTIIESQEAKEEQ